MKWAVNRAKKYLKRKGVVKYLPIISLFDKIFSEIKGVEFNEVRRVAIVNYKSSKLISSIGRCFLNARLFQYNESTLPNFKKNDYYDIVIFECYDSNRIDHFINNSKIRSIVILEDLSKNICIDKFLMQSIVSSYSIFYTTVNYFDIFMPIGPKDYEIAQKSIDNKFNKLSNLREVFYCSSENLNLSAEFVNEDKYPFTLNDVVSYLSVNINIAGWYYQQLKQFYFSTSESTCLENYLTICTDVFFNKDVQFFINNKPVYTYGHEELHTPYFNHMNKIHPFLWCYDEKSAISHHSIFNKKILLQLFNEVRMFSGLEFWRAFLQAVNDSDKNNSGAAEYEIYFNYLRYIKEDIAVREPNYVDTGDFNFGINSSFDFFAYHWHMRDNL